MKTQEGEKIWKENKRKLIGLTSIKCKCGRKILCKRDKGHAVIENRECGVCRTVGLEKSREEFLLIHKAKSKNVVFDIQNGTEDKGLKIKRKQKLITGERFDINREIEVTN